jgi:hypothetical protein
MFGKRKQIKTYRDVKKPKPGEIILVPRDNRINETKPFVNSAKTLPEWFKTIDKKNGSIRSCSGTLDFLQLGITVPMWTNAYFTPNLNLGAQWEVLLDQISYAEPFNNEPFPFHAVGRCPMTDVRGIERSAFPKLVNPWCFMTAPGWSSIVLPPLFEPSKDWQTVPSIVHTDFYHNLNLVLNITAESAFTIKAGTPMMQIIPFKRNKDIDKINIEDESLFRFVTARGFGETGVIPTQTTGRSYKTYQRKIDNEVEEAESSKNTFLKRIKNGKS